MFFEYCSASANIALVICYPSANEVMDTYAGELYNRGDIQNRVAALEGKQHNKLTTDFIVQTR